MIPVPSQHVGLPYSLVTAVDCKHRGRLPRRPLAETAVIAATHRQPRPIDHPVGTVVSPVVRPRGDMNHVPRLRLPKREIRIVERLSLHPSPALGSPPPKQPPAYPPFTPPASTHPSPPLVIPFRIIPIPR